jgi:hypothetical protein
MLPEDEILFRCNESELLWMARAQGLPILKRGLPKEELVAIVAGAKEVPAEYIAQTLDTRKALEGFITKYWDMVRSQLPGCNGKCSTFNCSEGRHAACLLPNIDKLT